MYVEQFTKADHHAFHALRSTSKARATLRRLSSTVRPTNFQRKIINTMWHITIIMIALVVASGCTNSNNNIDDDIMALHEFIKHAGDAVNSGDVEAEVNRFEPNGIYMWPGVPAIEGHEALRQWFEMRFSKYEIELESESLELEVAGEWAYERGRSVARIRSKEGGYVRVVRGKYLNILRKQPDGDWKIARRIRNTDHLIGMP